MLIKHCFCLNTVQAQHGLDKNLLRRKQPFFQTVCMEFNRSRSDTAVVTKHLGRPKRGDYPGKHKTVLNNRKVNLHEIADILKINVYITPQTHEGYCYDVYGLRRFLNCKAYYL